MDLLLFVDLNSEVKPSRNIGRQYGVVSMSPLIITPNETVFLRSGNFLEVIAKPKDGLIIRLELAAALLESIRGIRTVADATRDEGYADP